MRLPLTPSQTIGPFFHDALRDLAGPEVVPPEAPGAVRIAGRVLDGEGEPVSDAMIEIWQAGPAGSYEDPDFGGFGRGYTDGDGRFELVTVKPGRVPGPEGRLQAPHLEVSVFARGLLDRLVTRMYFPDEESANASDPVLSSIEDPAARESLVASVEDGELRFDIRLQGDEQTVFFGI